jgi:gliding motility-associated-like protein
VKQLFAILICFLAISVGHGQLQNPGFESYSTLPDNTGQFSRCIGWSNAGSTSASPDYYHYSASASADLPVTPMASVNAFDGSAVMGFCATGPKYSNTREYLSTEFTQPLIVGEEYILSFNITNGGMTDVSTAGLAASKLGLLLSMGAVTQMGQDPLNLTPQFRIDTVFYSTTWKNVSFTFICTQPFTHMTFGVFQNDAQVDIVPKEGSNPTYAYYFVDEFYLEVVPEDFDPIAVVPGRDGHNGNGSNDKVPVSSDNAAYFIPNTFTPNNDGFNDIFIPVAGTQKEWKFEIFNRWGNKIFITEDESMGWNGIAEGKNSPDGTYFWVITYQQYDDQKGTLVTVVDEGYVTLIR